MNKYREEYEWSNIFAMLRNLKKQPEICTQNYYGRLVVISGATSGIGYATAEKFASHGADLLVINRNERKSRDLCEVIRNQYDVDCSYLIADFSRLADVHSAGKHLAAMARTIDVFIHNTGVYVTRKTYTADNLETVFQTNYLSAFILNEYVKMKLLQQKRGRILFVNSEAHRFAVWGLNLDDLNWEKNRYTGWKSYGAAKLAQLLSMIPLTDVFEGSGVTVNAMHPGNVKTRSGQNNGPLYKLLKKIFIDRTAKTPDIAAEALYYLGVSRDLENTSGKFFNLTTEEDPAPPALDRDAAKALRELSLELGGLK
ncbi:MAG: SDR family NAD(P)-dependent oxidoreductase [Anaerolineales bacterium]|nr:SDR family NAD(P)-dependent oxidoreductase [Anaerolineales bacterium]